MNAEPSTPQGDDPNVDPRIDYLVLRFPKLSETFIAREVAGLRERGWDVRIYPLWRDTTDIVHDLVRPLLPAVRWKHPLSRSVLTANARQLARRPKRYMSTLLFVASDIRASPTRGLKALALFPIMVWIASDMERRGTRHVHAHFASYPSLAALVAHRLIGITYSFTAHAYDLYVSPLKLRGKVANASLVITISEYNRKLIHDLAGVSTPVEVIHCGVEIPPSLPAAPSADVPRILSVARLEEKKGHGTLIAACALLRDRGVRFSCSIVGGGPQEPMLRGAIEKHGLQGHVRLTGPVPFDVVQQMLADATVFALACEVARNGNADGIPVALMEAMAAGVPVVSTRVTGIPELIDDGESGMLVEQRDPAALADALERLLSDAALRDRLRRAGYERVAKDFRLESCLLSVSRALSRTVSS